MRSWRDIKPFISGGDSQFNVGLSCLNKTISEYQKQGLQLNPDFQRGHVWTKEQQALYCEYFLKSGLSGRIIYLNDPNWSNNNTTEYTDFVCVDGLQRLTALMSFMNNKLPVFGSLLSGFDGKIRTCRAHNNLKININSLQTKKEVLEWYVQMNTGGTLHTNNEIQKVQDMIKEQGNEE